MFDSKSRCSTKRPTVIMQKGGHLTSYLSENLAAFLTDLRKASCVLLLDVPIGKEADSQSSRRC
jgi:hypothetical protein